MTDRYANGKIYTIRCHSEPELVYVGSTCLPLSKRFYAHKSSYEGFQKGMHNSLTTSFDIVQYADCYIELYEEYPCDNKQQLSKREGEVIRSLQCVNKCIAGRTLKEYNKEYYEQNKDNLLEQYKRYRKQNREIILEKQKIWREKNKEEIMKINKQYYENNKQKILEQQRGYYEENKEKVLCQMKNHYKQNRDSMLKKKNEKKLCHICNCAVSKGGFSRHKESNKHKKNLLNQ